jgi:hypothetical protein
VAVAPEHTAIVVDQVAIPGVATAAIGSTPEDSEASNIAETTIKIAITTWES